MQLVMHSWTTRLKKELFPFYHSRMTSTSSKFGIFATVAVTEYDLHLLPWASVAACIFKAGLEVIPYSFSI
jgi:sacsin